MHYSACVYLDNRQAFAKARRLNDSVFIAVCDFGMWRGE